MLTQRSSARRRIIAALALFAAAYLLIASTPRLVAALLLIEVGDPARAHARGRPVEIDEITRAIEAHTASLEWHEDPRVRRKQAELYFLLWRRLRWEASGSRHLEAAIRDYRRLLADAPGQSYAWYALALAAQLGAQDAEELSRLYRAAVDASLHHPQLAVPRALMGLRAWPSLDPPARDALRRQLTVVADLHARSFAQAVDSPSLIELTRVLLADEPDRLLKIENAFAERD